MPLLFSEKPDSFHTLSAKKSKSLEDHPDSRAVLPLRIRSTMLSLSASASLAAPVPARRTAVVRRAAALSARRVKCKVSLSDCLLTYRGASAPSNVIRNPNLNPNPRDTISESPTDSYHPPLHRPCPRATSPPALRSSRLTTWTRQRSSSFLTGHPRSKPS